MRRVPPPDFRYVWLGPGSRSAGTGFAASTLGVAGASVAVFGPGYGALSVGLSLLGGALALGLTQLSASLPLQRGAHEVAMAIVPWGVLITPDTEPRVIRWPAIRRVTVDLRHTLRGGTPAILSSLVSVHTDREILAGRSAGAVDLARLVANLRCYAREAARPVSSDLEGRGAIGDGVTEPVGADLLTAAELLCTSSRGAAELRLPHGGYRMAAARVAAPETVSILRSALAEGHERPADPRPLAAILAGVLGARELVPDLLLLASSPHPIVAAFAKAAALRLGAPLNRAGSLDEVAAFLFEEDVQLGKRWIDESPHTGPVALAAP